MHPRIKELEAHLAESHQILLAAVAGVPAELRQVRPAADAWSVAEVVEHLGLVERRAAQLIGQMIAQGAQENAGPDPDTTPLMPSLNVSYVLDRSRKVQSLDTALPARKLDTDTALRELAEARARTMAVIHSAEGVNLSRIQHAHAFFGPLSAYEWIAFVGAHEQRHAAQIREVGAALAARR